MSKILFVAGMNTRRIPAPSFERKYTASLLSLLQRSGVGGEDCPAPSPTDIELLYWTDLIPAELPPPSKGLIEDLQHGWLDLCRRIVLKLDATAEYDLHVTPGTALGRQLRVFIEQAVMYMGNYPAAYLEDPRISPGLRDQVQERFNRKLCKDTRIVIGHSLGSVIAYEGLCAFPHSVDLLMTVGSPMGIPKMIYDLMAGEAPHAWPNVEHWCNVHCAQDVFFVPVPELAPLFHGGEIQDLRVQHGSFWTPDTTHRLDNYFQHLELGSVLADAWRRTVSAC